jgi:hypothetical protein
MLQVLAQSTHFSKNSIGGSLRVFRKQCSIGVCNCIGSFFFIERIPGI